MYSVTKLQKEFVVYEYNLNRTQLQETRYVGGHFVQAPNGDSVPQPRIWNYLSEIVPTSTYGVYTYIYMYICICARVKDCVCIYIYIYKNRERGSERVQPLTL